jgi:dipeptidyl aminopeptidase/acylaminoacyl peptidase
MYWLSIVLVLMLFVQTAHSNERTQQIELDDYFTQAYVNSVAISPDGKWVAYTEMRWEPPAESRNTELWVVSTAGGDPRRLTFDPAADGGAQWSADSRFIFFTSARGKAEQEAPLNGETQIWKIAVEGGEALAVTRLKDGISAFQVSCDGRSLYYATSEKTTEDEWKELRDKYDEVEYGDGVTHTSTLWRLDLVAWRTEKVVDEKRHIVSFEVARDHSKIAMITTPTDQLITNEGQSRVDVYDVKTKTVSSPDAAPWRAQAPSPYGWIEAPAWSPDGNKLAFSVGFDGYPAELFVVDYSGGHSHAQKLRREREFAVADGSALVWMPNSTDLCVRVEERAHIRLGVIRGIQNGKQGALELLTTGEPIVEQYSITPAGDKIAVNLSDVGRPGDVYVCAAAAFNARKELTHVNPQIDSWKLPSIQTVSWIGANGDSVEGLLELPPDYVPGQPLPTLVCVHGGPTGADLKRFEFWIYGKVLFSTMGWAVFSPNYRGSTGYGDQFLTDLVGRENEIEVEDILSGVDALVARGIADSSKLAVSGWSNGGYLTNCLITQTTRFKAASSGAGVLDMAMQWGTEDTPGHVINFMRGKPWENPEALEKASPLYKLDRVNTPTLIHVGAEDPRVPAIHSKTLHRALHEYLGVPTELILYPGQGHGITKMTQRRCKMEWDIAWFKKYVLQLATEEPPRPAQ